MVLRGSIEFVRQPRSSADAEMHSTLKENQRKRSCNQQCQKSIGRAAHLYECGSRAAAVAVCDSHRPEQREPACLPQAGSRTHKDQPESLRRTAAALLRLQFELR